MSYNKGGGSVLAKRKTHEEFEIEVFNLVGDEYTVLGEYKSWNTKLMVKHNVCGNMYEVRPHNLLNGTRCNNVECINAVKRNPQKKTTISFKDEVYKLVGDEYDILGDYINANTNISVKHQKCGHTYEVTPNKFLGGYRCTNPLCIKEKKRKNHKRLKTTEVFKEEVYTNFGDEFTIIGEYVNAYTDIETKHNKCGHVWEARPNNILKGRGCPNCRMSKGERFTKKVLDDLNIKYKQHKTFKGLRDKNPLSYDFYLPHENILIEYQGIQHYKPSFDVSYFETQQKHDRIKRKFAEEKGFILIEIPYTEDTYLKIKDYFIGTVKSVKQGIFNLN